MVIVALIIQLAIIIILGFFMYCNLKKIINNAYKYQSNLITDKGNFLSFKEPLLKIDVPVINIKINDKKYGFLLDSGADNNYLDMNVFNELGGTKSFDITGSRKVNTANGAVETVKATIPFKIGNNKFKEEFDIMPITQNVEGFLKGTDIRIDGILGSKFFAEYKWKLDFDKMVVWTN